VTQLHVDLVAEGPQREPVELQTARCTALGVETFVLGHLLGADGTSEASRVSLGTGAGDGVKGGVGGAGAVRGGHSSEDSLVQARISVVVGEVVTSVVGARGNIVYTMRVIGTAVLVEVTVLSEGVESLAIRTGPLLILPWGDALPVLATTSIGETISNIELCATPVNASHLLIAG